MYLKEGSIKMEKKIYGAYGSNTNISQMVQRCPKAEILGKCWLKDYQLTFKGFGVANVEPKEGSQVPLVLWRTTEQCEYALDRYEGYPTLYNKKQVTVETDQGEIKIYIYVMVDAEEYSLPTNSYYNSIIDGYNDNNLPLEYLTDALANCRIRLEVEQ
jgi:gamma-glutamylcyclotransferase (GGCT)/AIG2-like uncharacterized protein YtfP